MYLRYTSGAVADARKLHDALDAASLPVIGVSTLSSKNEGQTIVHVGDTTTEEEKAAIDAHVAAEVLMIPSSVPTSSAFSEAVEPITVEERD